MAQPLLPSPPPADDGPACRVCRRGVAAGHGLCFCCRRVAGQLGLPLVPVVALCEYRVGDRTHQLLRGYKDAPVAEARAACRRRLAAELGGAVAQPDRPPLGRLGRWDLVAAVPSSHRPGPAPVEALIESVPSLAAVHRRLLGRGPAVVDHLVADRKGFALLAGTGPDVGRDRRVLLVDDTTTTGARAQSAAAALRLSGGEVAGVLVLGRALAARDGGHGHGHGARWPGGPDRAAGRAARARPGHRVYLLGASTYLGTA